MGKGLKVGISGVGGKRMEKIYRAVLTVAGNWAAGER